MSRLKQPEQTLLNGDVFVEPEDATFDGNDKNFNLWLRIHEQLCRPFPVNEHNYRIISTTKNGAWVAFYVDLRSMMERLQTVVGHRFFFSVQPVAFNPADPNGVNVKAILTINIGNTSSEQLTVEDFGYAPPNTAEPLKSATTDALRRVLSHVGIGRYLYRLPRVFIRGRQTEGGFKYDIDPLKVLEKLLKEPTNEKVVFFPERGSSDAHEEQPTVGEWDMDVETFRRTYKVKRSTDKQIRAFMRLVKPTDTEAQEIGDVEDPDDYIKFTLDRRLG